MKSPYLLPAVTAVLGFTIAWVVKPAPEAPATGETTAAQADAGRIKRSGSGRTRTDAAAGRTPAEVNAGDFPLYDRHESEPKTRSESKMLRLTEALDLSFDQQGAIISALEETKSTGNDDIPALDDFLIRGSQLEEKLAAILSPEQLANFEELRVRERENLIESRAQKSLNSAIAEIDLSPGQREDVLARLRQLEKERIQSIPGAAALLLKTSVLPSEDNELTVDGLLVLNEINENQPTADPHETHQNVMRRHKEVLERQLECFDGILSPAQMGQYYASINAQITRLDRLRDRPRKRFEIPEEIEPDVEYEEDAPFLPKEELQPYIPGQTDYDE